MLDFEGRLEDAWKALSPYRETDFPPWLPVRQKFPAPRTDDVRKALLAGLEVSGIRRKVKPGQTAAIAVGSRGIADIALLVRTLAEVLVARGIKPFIVPAMGSHGGGTPEGQRETLASLGITAESAGVPIRSASDTVELGSVPGGPAVFMDSNAAGADLIIPVCRIKPHTGFRGPFESGAVKMLVVGLGKQRGAAAIHGCGMENFGPNLEEAGRFVLGTGKVPFAVCVVENAYDQIARVEVVPGENILGREPELLREAKNLMGKLPADDIDVLVVGEIGKEISGAGLDPNITGRFSVPGLRGGPEVGKLVALDVTEASHGNAIGMGLADISTAKVLDKLDVAAMYLNAVTSTVLNAPKIPVIMKNDKDAIALALNTCRRRPGAGPRVVGIRNTLELGMVYVSKAIWEENTDRKDLEAAGPLSSIRFDQDGNLLWFDARDEDERK
jgi:hypothetical protein